MPKTKSKGRLRTQVKELSKRNTVLSAKDMKKARGGTGTPQLGGGLGVKTKVQRKGAFGDPQGDGMINAAD